MKNKTFQTLVIATALAAASHVYADDSYDPDTQVLTIPKVAVGPLAYTNVKLKINDMSVLSFTGPVANAPGYCTELMLSQNNYQLISDGMNLSQVKALLGGYYNCTYEDALTVVFKDTADPPKYNIKLLTWISSNSNTWIKVYFYADKGSDIDTKIVTVADMKAFLPGTPTSSDQGDAVTMKASSRGQADSSGASAVNFSLLIKNNTPNNYNINGYGSDANTTVSDEYGNVCVPKITGVPTKEYDSENKTTYLSFPKDESFIIGISGCNLPGKILNIFSSLNKYDPTKLPTDTPTPTSLSFSFSNIFSPIPLTPSSSVNRCFKCSF